MTLRFRTKGSIKSLPVVQETQSEYSCSGAPRISWTSSPIGAGQVETMLDNVVYQFLRRQARGQTFFNSLDQTRTTAFDGGGVGPACTTTVPVCVIHLTSYSVNGSILPHLLRLKYGLNDTGVPPTVGVFQSDVMQRLDTEVTTRCLAQRGASQNNIYEDIAEWRQTRDMLQSPLQKLKVLSMRIPVASSVAAASHLWLQYRYGVMPLVRTVDTILKAHGTARRKRRLTTRAKGELLSQSTSLFLQPLGIWKPYVRANSTDSYKVRAMSLDEAVTDVMFESGFSSKGLFTLPWELVPYSFVADWFVNVGDFLGAIVPTPGFKNLGDCIVRTRETTTSFSIDSVTIDAPYVINAAPSGTYKVSRLTRTRRPLGNPGLVVKQNFKFDDPRRIADSMSLIAQRFMRSFRFAG